MISLAVDASRLTRSRFALSRLAELGNGLEVLTHPERAPYAHDWVVATRPRAAAADLAVLLAVVERATWYVPDFLVPVPASYEPTLRTELDQVAGTPPEVVRQQLARAFRLGPPPPDLPPRQPAAAADRDEPAAYRADRDPSVGRPADRDIRPPLPAVVADVLAAGEGALAACLAEQLERCWRRAMAGSWPTLQRILDEDVRHHSAVAGRVGFGEIISGLHPQLSWDGSRVTLPIPLTAEVDAAAGLVLVPSVFLPRPALWAGKPGQPMVGYPARGRGRVWAAVSPPGASDGTDVLGPRRAALLADLDTPRSTTDLAARHGLSAATVSYHLGRLRRAGLVAGEQVGHAVLYQRTPRARALLGAVTGG
ncbi:DUF5937 family protein [Plantactinospora siamensis]|uniref:DUF5937 family protein n=1 Tax=Plantactinospora siamensis TaxID=555372 RepID=A0ABV6P353_9ACTN